MNKTVRKCLQLAGVFGFLNLVNLALLSNTYALACATFEAKAKDLIKQDNITGMAITVVSPHQKLFCSYGYTDQNKTRLINNKSIFEIASVTKTFTAMLAGIAIDENKIKLNNTVVKELPELFNNKEFSKVTLKSLLTHTSGLPLVTTHNQSYTELMSYLKDFRFVHEPGTYYEYSNIGMSLAGIVIAKSYSDTDYSTLLNDKILRPLKMHYTSLDTAAKHQSRIVTGYDKDGNAVPIMNVGIDVAAGGILSNTYDLSKYLKLQLSYSDEQNESVDQTFRDALNIVHNNFYCIYPNQVYQQLAWEFHPLSELDVSYQPNKEGQSILMPHRLPTNCPLYKGDGFIDKTGNAHGMSSYIAYIPGKVGVAILVNNALKPHIVDLGRYILK